MEDLRKYKLITVLGPTASGKTKFAVRLADALDAEIISADSRQVYKDMDIGTGKDLADYEYNGRRIPCHLTDIVEAGTKYDLFRYRQDFGKVYPELISRGKRAILCGGSGLYIESVVRNYSIPEVPQNQKLREDLEKRSDKELIALHQSLATPHNITDYDTRKRLIRAIEIAMYRKEHSEDAVVFSANPTTVIGAAVPQFRQDEVKLLGISVSREERNARIDRRLDERLQEGMIAEVQGLLDRGIPAENLIYYGLEYKFVTLYLTGRLSYDEMRNLLAIAIHQFAKRQMTWFRGMERRGLRIEWIDNPDLYIETLERKQILPSY